MNDPYLVYSAGGSRQCDVTEPGSSARTTVARGLTELWQIWARINGDLSMQGASDCPWLNLCCPHCSQCEVVTRHEPKGCQGLRHHVGPWPSALPVAVLAAPLTWRRQWLA